MSILTTTSNIVNQLDFRKIGTTTYSTLYTNAINSTALTITATFAKNLQHGVPIVFTKSVTLDRLGIEVTTGSGSAGTVSRIGIYADNGNNGPGSLILDAGTVDNTSGTLQLITINQTLPPGLYWLSFVHNSTLLPSIRTLPVGALGCILGNPTTAGASALTLIAPAFTYSTLPSTFTTYSGSDIYTSASVAFFMRFSA